MAYVQPVDISLNPNDPLTAEKLQALRDNPVEMFAGASGAPQLVTAAIGDGQVTQAKMATDSVGSAQIIANSINVSEMNFQVRSYAGTIAAGATLYFQQDDYMLFPQYQYGSGAPNLLSISFISSGSPNDKAYIGITNNDSGDRSYLLYWHYLT